MVLFLNFQQLYSLFLLSSVILPPQRVALDWEGVALGQEELEAN